MSVFSRLTHRHIFYATLVLLGALLLVLQRRPFSSLGSSTQSKMDTSQAATSFVPAFTSAGFPSGDPLKGLGPEWTYLRQSSLSSEEAPWNWLLGTLPQTETVVKLIRGDVELTLDQAQIKDMAALERALNAPGITPLTVAGRSGYVIPMGDIAGGTGLLLKGTSSVLLLQDTRSLQWPVDVSPEVLAYIQTVHIP